VLHSVIIGINTYSDPKIPNLRSARSDAEAVSLLLREGIVASERTVKTLLDEQATRRAVVEAVGEALPRKQNKGDLVLIYFAGHGSPEQENPPDKISRYLVPHDTEYRSVFATGLGLETDLVALLDRQSTGRVLLILDACFSGQAASRSFLGPHLERRAAQFRAPISLRHLDLGFGRGVMAACADDESAQEDADHGVFTRNLLDALRISKHPTIGIGELYEDVFMKVVQQTRGAQHPVLKGEFEGMRLPRLTGPPRKAAR
jgi:uncharacterized caspase-like protein